MLYWPFKELRACPTPFSFHRLPKDNISWGRFDKGRRGERERIIENAPIIMPRAYPEKMETSKFSTQLGATVIPQHHTP
jgi:hypothetical protein